MAVKLRAMRPEDYKALGSQVKTIGNGKNSGSVIDDALDSEKLFGSVDYTSKLRSLTRDNRRAYIELAHPTINHVLADPVIRKVLNVDSATMQGIMNYSLAYLIDEEDYVKVSDLVSGDSYLVGGDIVEMLIKDFDLEYEREMEFFHVMIKNHILLNSAPIEELGDIVIGGEIPLVGGYGWNPSENAASYFGRRHVIENLTEDFRKVCFNTPMSRLSILLNLKDKEPLWGFLNYYVAVLPSGLRPKINKRRDRFTKSYTRIITFNQQLLSPEGQLIPTEFVPRYRDLDYAVTSLQFKNMYKYDGTEGPYSVMDKIKSKTGHIRANNLGKRQDYSGRAAVTVNPYLELDQIGVPKKLIAKIYKYHALPYISNEKSVSATTPRDVERIVEVLQKHKILDNVPSILGRQPTLHKHGALAFYVIPVDTDAIQVSPLVCVGFNMDFDGDSAHIEVPMSDEAIKEVTSLMLASQNLYFVKSGKCAIVPRQDMLYGLYFCTRSTYSTSSSVGNFDSYTSVYEAIIQHKVKVWDTVTVQGVSEIAGYAAYKSCFPKSHKVEVTEVTSETIEGITNELLDNYPQKVCLKSIHKLVMLGFLTARFYTQSISLLRDEKEIPEYDEAYRKFEENIRQCDYYFSLGLEDEETFNLEYSRHLEELNKVAKKCIKEKIGEDSGFCVMADSGARGNMSNLLQMFAYKGKIAVTATETINVIVKNSYSSQLTPMEGSMTAYGGRKGLIDKSLKTADTGYFSRQLWHASQGIIITTEDCGSTEGFTIQDIDLQQFYKTEEERKEVMEFFITGRYEAGTNMYIDRKRAKQIAQSRHSITVRSPMTCKNPCCQMCYGIDPGTHKMIAVGASVGIAAAHSIGETSSQLTLEQFKKGGVASKDDVTSSFQRLDDFVNVANLPKKQRDGGVTSYEPIAWASGRTKVVHKGTVKNVSIEGDPSNKMVVVPQEAIISPYVEKGVGIYANMYHGDYYLKEIIDICGIEAAKAYLVFQMYNINKDECEIAPVHFEIIVLAMSQYMIYSTDRDDLKVGQYASRKRLLKGPCVNTEYREELLGVDSIPKCSIEALATIIMEDPRQGLARCNILGLKDDLEDSLQRLALALPIRSGTYFGERFVEERRLE